jgi:hypothetical protein
MRWFISKSYARCVGESVSAVSILLFSRGNGRAFPIDSGRVAIGAHVPRRRKPFWHGAASENDLSSGLCASTQCPRYQRRFVHSLPLNSACFGTPLRLILGTAARLIFIWRKSGSTAAGVFRPRKIRRSWKPGFATRVRKRRTRGDTLFDSACERLRSLRVELPAEGELERVVNRVERSPQSAQATHGRVPDPARSRNRRKPTAYQQIRGGTDLSRPFNQDPIPTY